MATVTLKQGETYSLTTGRLVQAEPAYPVWGARVEPTRDGLARNDLRALQLAFRR